MTTTSLIGILAKMPRDAEVFMIGCVESDGYEQPIERVDLVPRIVVVAQEPPPSSPVGKVKPKPLPESVEVNHHSIVIRVYRHGAAGSWFATVAKDCIQVFRGPDWTTKPEAIQDAAEWLKAEHDPR